MIFHINRVTLKPGLSREQREAGLNLLRQAGAANPAARSFVVGPELGGDFEWGAVYVVEDLEGYWEYLTPPGACPLRGGGYRDHRAFRGLRRHGLR